MSAYARANAGNRGSALVPAPHSAFPHRNVMCLRGSDADRLCDGEGPAEGADKRNSHSIQVE
jgi:hypothetical protein